MNPDSQFAMKDLKWRDATDREVARLVRSSRGEMLRSSRGFGYRRCRNEVLPNQSSYRDGWLYDTFSVGAGAAFPTTSMFSTQQGVGGKALNATNLTGQGGQIPAGQTLKVRSIRFYISNNIAPADLQNIINNVSVEFKVNNVPIFQATPEWFPAGNGGVTLAAANTGIAAGGSAVVTSSSNGMPVQSAAYTLLYPYDIESTLPFTILVTPQVAFNMVAAGGTNPPGVGVTIRCYLEGDKQGVVTG